MAKVTETPESAARLTERIRPLVERMHAEGRTPREIVSALAYELAAEIAFGVQRDDGHPQAAGAIVDEFAQMMKMQIMIFGRDRHP